MTTQQHPAQFDWATELSDAQGRVTLSAQEAKEIGARLRSMGEKLKAYEDLDEAASDVQLLRMGYAAARLEIESLQARIKTMAEEHADELMVAHMDGIMRAALAAAPAQPAPQQEAQEPVAWYVTGCGRLLDEDEAKAEARRIGGTARAMPLYTAPQPTPTPQADSQPAPQQEASPTAGMNIAQRILHVGGRNNAAGYVEFGSIQAVEALVKQVLRDLPAPQPLPALQGDALSQAARDVLAERRRQVEVEGFDAEHDGEAHDGRDLAEAAACYLLCDSGVRPLDRGAVQGLPHGGHLWPWEPHWWKPKDEYQNLKRAGALVLARMDQLNGADADLAARAPASSVLEDAARLTYEQAHAIRQGHEISASDGYFEARPQIDSNDRRKVFQAGFERGWDAARKQGANHD